MVVVKPKTKAPRMANITLERFMALVFAINITPSLKSSCYLNREALLLKMALGCDSRLRLSLSFHCHLEPTVGHALDVKRHRFFVAHSLEARVFHDLGVDAVAMRPQIG